MRRTDLLQQTWNESVELEHSLSRVWLLSKDRFAKFFYDVDFVDAMNYYQTTHRSECGAIKSLSRVFIFHNY